MAVSSEESVGSYSTQSHSYSGAETAVSVWWLGYRLDDTWLESWQGQEIFLFSKNVLTGSRANPASCSVGTRVSFCKGNNWGVRLSPHLRHVPMLRVIGSMTPLCLYAFMVCTGTTLPLPYFVRRVLSKKLLCISSSRCGFLVCFIVSVSTMPGGLFGSSSGQCRS
jgi:hypothetical protein